MLLGPAVTDAQTVRTHVSTDSVSAGDVFQYSVALQLDEEYNRIVFPDTNLFPPSLELTGRQQFKLSQFADSLAYSLQYFGSEDVQIPEMPIILYTGEDTLIVYTEPITVYLKRLVDEGDTSIKPLKPIFDFPRAWWPWILAAILLAAFLIWWFKFREEPESEPTQPLPQIKPFYNPLKELEKTLISIKKKSKIAQTKEFKPFYSEISDAIRTYYEDLYKIPALESTTRELLRYLDAYGADQELLDLTRRILRNADLVKFAKQTPTLDDAQQTYQLAIEFMNRAKQADSARVGHLKSQYEAQFLRPETKNSGA